MKLSTLFLVAVGFVAASLLGGLVGAAWVPHQASASTLYAYGPPVHVTALQVKEQSANIFLEPYKIGDIGTFTIHNPASLVEVTYQGRLSYLGPGGALFQLRVDDKPLLKLTGEFVIQDNQPNTNVPSVFSGYMELLSASANPGTGEHTVSLWASEYQGGMIEGRVVINPGDLPGSIVIIKEYVAFGNTFFPSVQR